MNVVYNKIYNFIVIPEFIIGKISYIVILSLYVNTIMFIILVIATFIESKLPTKDVKDYTDYDVYKNKTLNESVGFFIKL